MAIIKQGNGEAVDVHDSEGGLHVTHLIDKAKLNAFYEHNQKLYNAVPQKQYKSALRKKNIWQVAKIPTWELHNILKDGYNLFTEEGLERFCKEKLNDGQYRKWRTSPGKV